MGAGCLSLRLAVRGLTWIGTDNVLNAVLERFVYRDYDADAVRGKQWRSRRFQILVYHRISPDQHPFFPPVQPGLFERQLEILKRFYRVMDLHELVERSCKRSLPERAVAITFDDGYRDNYLHALPLLRKYDMPATIFVATAAADNRKILWHDRVFDAFRFARIKRVRLPSWQEFEIVLEPKEQARQSLEKLLRRAKYLPGQSRLALVDELEEALQPDPTGHPRASMLSWEEMKEMQAQKIQFGSHTVTHPVLTCIDEQQLSREIVDSKAELEARLGTKVTAFAYPNGQPPDYNEKIKQNCGTRVTAVQSLRSWGSILPTRTASS